MPANFCCPPWASAQPARCGFRAALIAIVFTLSGCSGRPPIEDHLVGDVGHIEVRKADPRIEGVVVGATQGSSEPDAAELAKAFSDGTGAGLIIAYGFRSKRIPVAQPLVHMSPVIPRPADGSRPGSVYPQFRALLQNTVSGPLKFYIGVRSAHPKHQPSRIEVASAGLTFEQVQALKAAFVRIRDRVADNGKVPKIEMALNPLDEISWNVTGVTHHGVLLLAEKGLILRLPKIISTEHVKPIYTKVLTDWVAQGLPMVMQNPSRLTEMEVQLMQYGRMELTPSRKNLSGIVIGAPHGSFDRHTAELAQQLGYRTAIAVVAAKGFSPTEGGGWRINVNRPTEKLYPLSGPELERATDRARVIYQRFRDAVLKAAAGPLDLYFDLHQNSHDENIDVATLGISPDDAIRIKTAYMEIRERVLRARTGLPKVNLAIEPIDKVTFRARVAKEHGILRWAKQSIHFEMPAHRVFYDTRARQAYTEILSQLIQRVVILRRSSIAARSR
jgi:hypothetical protein